MMVPFFRAHNFSLKLLSTPFMVRLESISSLSIHFALLTNLVLVFFFHSLTKKKHFDFILICVSDFLFILCSFLLSFIFVTFFFDASFCIGTFECSKRRLFTPIRSEKQRDRAFCFLYFYCSILVFVFFV